VDRLTSAGRTLAQVEIGVINDLLGPRRAGSSLPNHAVSPL